MDRNTKIGLGILGLITTGAAVAFLNRAQIIVNNKKPVADAKMLLGAKGSFVTIDTIQFFGVETIPRGTNISGVITKTESMEVEDRGLEIIGILNPKSGNHESDLPNFISIYNLAYEGTETPLVYKTK